MDVSQINQKNKLYIVNCKIVTKKLQLIRGLDKSRCEAFVYTFRF